MTYLNIYIYKDLDINVQSIFIYNSQNMKIKWAQVCSSIYLAGGRKQETAEARSSKSVCTA